MQLCRNIHVCLIVWDTLVRAREAVLYWITGQYRFPAKYSVTILERTFAFSSPADQNDKKMAVIFGLYVSGAVSCDWLSVSRSANQKLLLSGQSEAAEWRLSLQELYQELETQRGLSRGNTRTGSRKTYASMDITRWERSSERENVNFNLGNLTRS